MKVKVLFWVALAIPAMVTTSPVSAQALSFWSWHQQDLPTYERIIKAFEAANPDITVKFSGYLPETYDTNLTTALDDGAGPDVMQTQAYGPLESKAQAGYLMPLDNTIIPGLDNFPKLALAAETSRANGEVYGVPADIQTVLVIYNKKLFADNAIAIPTTWAEMMADAKKLRAKGIFPFANGTATPWQNEVLVDGLGSSIMGREFYNALEIGNTDFNDARYVSALDHIKDASRYFPDGFSELDYNSSRQLFIAGMAAMFVGSASELTRFRTENTDLDLGVFAAPGASGKDQRLVAQYFEGGFAGNANTKYPDAVRKFLAYLGSKEVGQILANELGVVSPVPGVIFDDPLLQRVSKLNARAIPDVMLADFGYQVPLGSDLLQAAVQKMLAGEITPTAAAKSITDGIGTYYLPFQKLAKSRRALQ